MHPLILLFGLWLRPEKSPLIAYTSKEILFPDRVLLKKKKTSDIEIESPVRFGHQNILDPSV